MFWAQKNKFPKHLTDVLATFGVEQRLLHSVEKTSFSTADPIALLIPCLIPCPLSMGGE
jgi:hypothetical protein